MYINPKHAIEQGWITHPSLKTLEDWEGGSFISPNAIDFTLDTLHSINHNNTFILSEIYKQHRGGKEILPETDHDNQHQYWTIEPNSVYDGMSKFYVEIPEGVCAELIIRSTLNRNGIFITGGIYDTKFSGNIGFSIHNRSGIAKIATNTRIGQIKFIESDSHGEYKGGYNNKNGKHWKDNQ